MHTTLSEVEFETRTIGPLVLTTPCLRRLGWRETSNRLCPVAQQADFDLGLVAALVVQCRLSDPRALYDMPQWAATYPMAGLYDDMDDAGQRNDDRVGRLRDALYPKRAMGWGEVIARAAQAYAIDLSRLHADTMPSKFAGMFSVQSDDASVPHLEPGDHPPGEWVPQRKLLALASGDGGLPVGFDALSGGTGDSATDVPQCEAFCEQARLARLRPLEEVMGMGDRKMPTADNQQAWWRLGVSDIGPTTMHDHDRATWGRLFAEGHRWRVLPSVAGRETKKEQDARTVYQGVGPSVAIRDPDSGVGYPVRHLSIPSSALAHHEAKRREAEMSLIEAAVKRLQGLVNTYDEKSPEVIVRRVQQKACKKRRASRYFAIEVVEDASCPHAPYALTYRIDQARVARDAALDGVDVLVAGGTCAPWDDAQLLREWKGQDKVEPCVRLTNHLFLCGPVCLKHAQRLVSLIVLIMVGCLVAGWSERQMRRVLAERQAPIVGLMPEGRATLRPSVARILRAFGDDSLVWIQTADGRLLGRRVARPNRVQPPILEVLGLPHPEVVCGGSLFVASPPGGECLEGALKMHALESMLLNGIHVVAPGALPGRCRATPPREVGPWKSPHRLESRAGKP